MSINRVATSQQNTYFLNQLQAAGSRLDQTQQQIASGKVADTYAGFGDRAQVLQATITAHARNDAYATATTMAVSQTDLQDAQLTKLSELAAQLKKTVSDTVAANDPRTLMAQIESIFSQATTILNSKDANGDYIYAGGKTDTAPVSVSTLDDLVALPAVSGAFTNGTAKKSVQVADGQAITFGVLASDVATGLMQALKDIAAFDAGGSGNFDGSESLSSAQNSFLTGHIAIAGTVAQDLTTVTARNGGLFKQLENAQGQQDSMKTLYGGFIEKVQETNMAEAATQLSLNQTALQAALQVTATLNQLSLLNYLPVR
jgi:flagellar hook-associated protein 3 FlgL